MSLERKLNKALGDPARSDQDKMDIYNILDSGTERDLKFYMAFSGLDPDKLGKNELVLDVGSGAANFVKEARDNGIAAIALDRKYTMPEGVLMLKNERFFEKVRRIMRGEKQKIPPALAALAEELPFRSEQFIRLFYIYSAFNYVRSAEQAKKIFDEGLRILKHGGSMHIYPINHNYKSDRYSLLSELLNDDENERVSEEFFRYVTMIEKAGRIRTKKAYPEVTSIYRDETGEQELYRYCMTVEKL